MVDQRRALYDERSYEAKQQMTKLSGDPGPNNDYPDLDRSTQAQRLNEHGDKLKLDLTTRDSAGQLAAMSRTSNMFRRVTDMMTQLNEAMNANNYIHDTIEAELQRVGRLNNDARKEVYKAQQRHLETSYAKYHSRLSSGIIVLTIVATALLSIIVAGWMQDIYGPWIFYPLLAALAIAYAIAMMVLFGADKMRRQRHFNQYYWGTIDLDEDEGECDD